MNDVLRDAYSALRFVTPLPHGLDCGKLCGARCCQGSDGDGMELFWGEERLFADDPHFTVRTDGARKLLVCRGICDRRTRPLACRMYPLYPVPQETEHGLSVHVVYDLRGLQTCPLVAPAHQARSAVCSRRAQGRIASAARAAQCADHA